MFRTSPTAPPFSLVTTFKVTSSCTRITKGDGTHECTWPVLEILWLHHPALELWCRWNSWKHLASPWELMVTSSCPRILKSDGTHESTWPVFESLWLHPPALELWCWWNSWKHLTSPWELMVTFSCIRIMMLMELMKAPGQSLRSYGYILLY